MSGRTVWPCSHLGHVPFKWCRVVPFCLFAGWLFGINPNPVCVSLGGVSHPTVSQCEQCEAQEALLAAQAALLLGCFHAGLLLRSPLF